MSEQISDISLIQPSFLYVRTEVRDAKWPAQGQEFFSEGWVCSLHLRAPSLALFLVFYIIQLWYSVITWLVGRNLLKSFCRSLAQPVAERKNNFLFGLFLTVTSSWNKQKSYNLQTMTTSWNTPPGGSGQDSSQETLLTPWWAGYSH